MQTDRSSKHKADFEGEVFWVGFKFYYLQRYMILGNLVIL